MIWTVCFAICLILLGITAKFAFTKRLGTMRLIFVLAGLFATTLVAYVPVYFTEYRFVSAFFGDLINALFVMAMDGEFMEAYEGLQVQFAENPLMLDCYYAVLAVLHIGLPAVSAMTAFTVIVKWFTQMRLRVVRRGKRPLHVFSQVNYNSKMLAADIRKNDPKCSLLFLEEDGDADHSELRDTLHCKIIHESMEGVCADAKHRKVYYYCVSEDQEANLDTALALLAGLENASAQVQKNHYIFLFSKDPALELMIDSVDKGRVEIDIINEYQMAVYSLLLQDPICRYADQEGMLNILISGFGELSKEFIRAASWAGQVCGLKLRMDVYGKQIADAVEDFKIAYPNLHTDRYDIRYFSYENEAQFRSDLTEFSQKANYIVAAEDSEAATIEKAVFLRRFFYAADGMFSNKPPVFAYIENENKADAVRNLRTAEGKPERRVNYDITPFGMAADIYTFQNITESDLEKLSKNVHLVYEDIFGSPVDPEKAMTNYNMFEVNKRSNKANALHIRYKLWMMGLDYTDDAAAEEVDFQKLLTPEKLQMLSVAEHDRWMAFLDSEGWITADIDQVKQYQQTNLSRGRHNCPILRMHPYICPYEELAERSEAMGLPDSRIYDQQMIARIPDILHDKWGITGKRYKIIRR